MDERSDKLAEDTNEPNTDRFSQDALSLSRRRFLKQGAVAGAAAAAMYVAPQFSTVTAQRAYAAITGPCTCEKVGEITQPARAGNELIVAPCLFPTVTYTVTGSNLGAVQASINANGPVDADGTRRAGSTEATLGAAYEAAEVEATKVKCPDDDKTDVWKVTVVIVQVTASLENCNVILPDWTTKPADVGDDIEFVGPCLEEWNRFITQLGIHEQGHVDIFNACLTIVGPRILGLSVTAYACTRKKAFDLAHAALAAEADERIEAAIMECEGEQDRYDEPKTNTNPSGTDHGAEQGAVLDTDIEC